MRVIPYPIFVDGDSDSVDDNRKLCRSIRLVLVEEITHLTNYSGDGYHTDIKPKGSSRGWWIAKSAGHKLNRIKV